jgi:hypothetical protein
MSNVDKKVSDLDFKMLQLQQQIKLLDEEKAKLITESQLNKEKLLTKEQKDLAKIRKSVKNSIDKYNELASTAGIKTNLGLLTRGGYLIYNLNDDGENEDGEEFISDDYDYSVNKYPSYAGWYPSSLSC